MNIAVLGAGVSGLVAAARLAERHRVTLFEREAVLGGHARTVDVEVGGRTLAVDTGFVVYNETTYPRFTRLLAELGVATRPSDMSFSVRNERTGLEYCGTSLSTLFAQPTNALRPSFLGMLGDVVRFNRAALASCGAGPQAPSLGELLDRGGFGATFRESYLLPMAAAVWSSTPEQILEMPAPFLVRFFANHGLLSVDGQFRWRTIQGGSRRYVERLARRIGPGVRTDARVTKLRREGGGVVVELAGAPAERFDRAVVAVHADAALALLAEPTESERRVLGAFTYQDNEGLLHTDRRLLPRARRARASWNYHVLEEPSERVTVTYDLSRLQGLPGRAPVLLTLNRPGAVDPARVLRRLAWRHPVFTPAAVAAQARHFEISGPGPVHFCGAYWGNGFHEDGVASAMTVCRALGVERGAEAA